MILYHCLLNLLFLPFYPDSLFDQFLHDDTDVLLIVMESSIEALTKRMFDMMEHLNEKPCLYITSPKIVKSDMVIPDSVLNIVSVIKLMSKKIYIPR